jgi:hypothetical protein
VSSGKTCPVLLRDHRRPARTGGGVCLCELPPDPAADDDQGDAAGAADVAGVIRRPHFDPALSARAAHALSHINFEKLVLHGILSLMLRKLYPTMDS